MCCSARALTYSQFLTFNPGIRINFSHTNTSMSSLSSDIRMHLPELVCVGGISGEWGRH